MASAFRAQCRFYDNTYNKSQSESPNAANLPDFKVLTSYTPEAAIAAAGWLIAAAEDAESNGKTIRQYKKDGTFTEVPGFTTSHSLWKGDQWSETDKFKQLSGSFSPMTIEASAPSAPAPVAPQEQCPMPTPPVPAAAATSSWG